MFRSARALALGAAVLLGSPVKAQSLDVVTNPIPQAYTDTCQSYSLAFALARAGVPGFTLGTVAEVRAAEKTVRDAINAEIRGGETAYSHGVWQRAVAQLTSNNYKLNLTDFTSFEQFMAEVARKTGIEAAGTLINSVSYLLSNTPVMTSFVTIGTNSYTSGHIVTIFGIDRSPAPVSTPPRLLLLNSAVKNGPATPGYAPICSSSTLPGDLRYTGALKLESTYSLKSYGGKFRLFWISRS
jgi:hypothetical protein